MASPTPGRTALRSYLAATLNADVEVVSTRAIGGGDAPGDPKQFGYGVPFEIECRVAGATRRRGVGVREWELTSGGVAI